MKNLKRILLALVIGVFMIHLMAWSNGNENMYTYTIEKDVSPMDIKKPSSNYSYYYEIIIVETVVPSSIPLLFESKYDSLPPKLDSRIR